MALLKDPKALALFDFLADSQQLAELATMPYVGECGRLLKILKDESLDVAARTWAESRVGEHLTRFAAVPEDKVTSAWYDDLGNVIELADKFGRQELVEKGKRINEAVRNSCSKVEKIKVEGGWFSAKKDVSVVTVPDGPFDPVQAFETLNVIDNDKFDIEKTAFGKQHLVPKQHVLTGMFEKIKHHYDVEAKPLLDNIATCPGLWNEELTASDRALINSMPKVLERLEGVLVHGRELTEEQLIIYTHLPQLLSNKIQEKMKGRSVDELDKEELGDVKKLMSLHDFRLEAGLMFNLTPWLAALCEWLTIVASDAFQKAVYNACGLLHKFLALILDCVGYGFDILDASYDGIFAAFGAGGAMGFAAYQYATWGAAVAVDAGIGAAAGIVLPITFVVGSALVFGSIGAFIRQVTGGGPTMVGARFHTEAGRHRQFASEFFMRSRDVQRRYGAA